MFVFTDSRAKLVTGRTGRDSAWPLMQASDSKHQRHTMAASVPLRVSLVMSVVRSENITPV